MSIFIKDVNPRVKVKKEEGDHIKTKVEFSQGDCPSTILFIFYLARIMDTDEIRLNQSTTKQLFWNQPSVCGWCLMGTYREKSNRSHQKCYSWQACRKKPGNKSIQNRRIQYWPKGKWWMEKVQNYRKFNWYRRRHQQKEDISNWSI